MRVLLIVLFSAITVFAEDPQAVSTNSPENLTIPARLFKTIDTNKCKAGDVVEMRTLEPVLIANGLVMPENAKLHGKIVGAASRQNDRLSWLLLVVDRAEWKRHTIALHAFIASQITTTAKTPGPINDSSETLAQAERAPYVGRAHMDPWRSAPVGKPLQDASDDGSGAPQLSSPRLDNLYIQQARNGAVFLFSPKEHLKLPSGTMFMLRNQPVAPAGQAGTGKPTGSTQ